MLERQPPPNSALNTSNSGENLTLRQSLLEAAANKCGAKVEEVASYINDEEDLLGYAKGGVESLVLFVSKPGIEGVVVRKILSERFVSAQWDPMGTGAMSPPLEKARLQIAYLQGLPDEAKPYFPEVYSFQERTSQSVTKDGRLIESQEIICDQSYVPGLEVSTFVNDHQPLPEYVARIHREILQCLRDKIHPHRKKEVDRPTIETSYLNKIISRLQLTQQAAPDTFTALLSSDNIVINDKQYKNISQLIMAFRNPKILAILEPRIHSLVMGDTNTENVKITNTDILLEAMREGWLDFTYDDLGIKFLDPRAIGFECCGAETVDDRMYDAKSLHNSLGNYDLIHSELFTIAVSQSNEEEPSITLTPDEANPFQEPYKDMDKHFLYIMEGLGVNQDEDPNWLIRFAFVMGSHFAAMPPFHLKKELNGQIIDDFYAQKRAIALYCEGIKWLNIAYGMLQGEREELYGIKVPPVYHTIFEASKNLSL